MTGLKSLNVTQMVSELTIEIGNNIRGLYHAIRGNSGHARCATLPYESHGYTARESVEHTLHERVCWFDLNIKTKKLNGHEKTF